MLQKEEELRLKVESADALQKVLSENESRIEDLELQLKRCISEKNDNELKMEEAEQDMGKYCSDCTKFLIFLCISIYIFYIRREEGH